MRYLLLITEDERAMIETPDERRAAVRREWLAVIEELRAAGKMLDGNPLRPTHSATTVRLENGRPVIADGPFAETREQLCGYFVIDATDLDDALSWAKKMPNLRAGGSVEIRPIVEIEKEQG